MGEYCPCRIYSCFYLSATSCLKARFFNHHSFLRFLVNNQAAKLALAVGYYRGMCFFLIYLGNIFAQVIVVKLFPWYLLSVFVNNFIET